MADISNNFHFFFARKITSIKKKRKYNILVVSMGLDKIFVGKCTNKFYRSYPSFHYSFCGFYSWIRIQRTTALTARVTILKINWQEISCTAISFKFYSYLNPCFFFFFWWNMPFTSPLFYSRKNYNYWKVLCLNQ